MRFAIRLILVAALMVGGLSAQRARLVTEPGAGRYLVAKEDLLDPNFMHTVVLLAHHDEEGSMGLVVNRPARVTVAEAFESMAAAEGHKEPVYLGGPVAPTAVMALMQSKKSPEEGQLVVGDLFLVANAKALEEQLDSGNGPLRIFAGYAGWGAGQLRNELEIGSWYVFEGDPGIAFDAKPGTLWERLIEQTQLRLAGVYEERPGVERSNGEKNAWTR